MRWKAPIAAAMTLVRSNGRLAAVRCLAPVVLGACMLGYTATAQAVLWQATFSAHAFLSDTDFGRETVSYLWNPTDMEYNPGCDSFDCVDPSAFTVGPNPSFHYSGLVNGGGGQAALLADEDNRADDVSFFSLGERRVGAFGPV